MGAILILNGGNPDFERLIIIQSFFWKQHRKLNLSEPAYDENNIHSSFPFEEWLLMLSKTIPNSKYDK
jgi:hypothetical protein